jgi:tetraprenyl-beta-curcumene synthase
MSIPIAGRRPVLAAAFAHAAQRYWLSVFPHVARHLRQIRRRARRIPDPVLRALACATLRAERGNLEGAAAFAVLVPLRRRRSVIRALVAFQAAYDYIDTLVEQPATDPLANGRQLHQALRVALDPSSEHIDYYRHHPCRDDGGYLRDLVDTCRRAIGSLPSQALIAAATGRAADRMVAYQSLNHGCSDYGPLATWAEGQTPSTCDLRWWETAAATASSLGVFALIAVAGKSSLVAQDVDAVEAAYFPWIGGLHVLLDSLVDLADDLVAGDHSLVNHYGSPTDTSDRLGAIASRAFSAAGELPDGAIHALILAAMASFYLCSAEAAQPATREAAERVMSAMGELALPTIVVLRARRAFGSEERQR